MGHHCEVPSDDLDCKIATRWPRLSAASGYLNNILNCYYNRLSIADEAEILGFSHVLNDCYLVRQNEDRDFHVRELLYGHASTAWTSLGYLVAS